MKKLKLIICMSIMFLFSISGIVFNGGNGYKKVSGETQLSVLEDYKGKIISIMGDSISTFDGYIPKKDGFNLKHRARYPQSNLLIDVEETWWLQLIKELDAKLGINDSWAGSTVSNFIDDNQGDVGIDASMASLTRIKNLGSNGTPDIILFYGGTNDIGRALEMGEFNENTASNSPDLQAVKWDNFANAYAEALLRMKYFYPNAKIISLLPTYTKSYYTLQELELYNNLTARICNYYEIPYIDLTTSGLTTDMLPDGIHPNAEGMDKITKCVLSGMLGKIEIEKGERIVYNISYELENLTSEKFYYKGVLAGEVFIDILSETELIDLSIFMGDKDITHKSYFQNGFIIIQNPVADIEIRAKADLTIGHLQELPKNIYNTTNLWNLLYHENVYYRNGWVKKESVVSVTFPVSTGDRIVATSFRSADENNSVTRNGIRVTYFNKKGVVASLTPQEVYAEYEKNGFITVPKDVIYVNIPMWTESEDNELYLLTLPSHTHKYEKGYCSCGEYLAPKYKVEDDRLYISYDNGLSWEFLEADFKENSKIDEPPKIENVEQKNEKDTVFVVITLTLSLGCFASSIWILAYKKKK